MPKSNNLTDCITCGQEVAKSARTCPHCGENLRRKFNWWAFFFQGYYYTGYGKLGKGVFLLLLSMIPLVALVVVNLLRT